MHSTRRKLCSIGFLCILNAYLSLVLLMKMMKRSPLKSSKCYKVPFLCLCNPLKGKPLQIGKIMPHRFRISTDLPCILKLDSQWVFFVKLNDEKFTVIVVFLDFVFNDLNVFFWIWKIGHWNDCGVRIDLLLESHEWAVCKYITKSSAGHADPWMPESSSSDKLWDFRKIWSSLEVVFKHVFLS